MPNRIDSELEICISTAGTISLVIGPLSLVVKLAIASIHGFDSIQSLSLHFVFPVLLTLLGVALSQSKPESPKVQQFLLAAWTELLLAFIKLVELQFFEHRTLYAALAMGLVLIFESRVIKSPKIVGLLALKFLVQWYLMDVYFGWLNTSITLMQGIGTCFIILLLCLNYSLRKRTLADMYNFRQSLKQYSENLDHLVETLASGLIILGDALNVVKMNSRAQSLLQCSEERLWNFFSVIEFNQTEASERNLTVSEAIELCRETSLHSHTPLGTILINNHYLNLTVTRIPWSCEPVMVLLLTDISSALQLETSQAENQLKTKFLQFIPHELRTPTVGILGSSERALALHKENQSADLGIHLDIITQSAKLLNSLINDIMDYTEFLSGVFTLTLSLTNVKECVAEAHSAFERQLSRQNLSFSVRIDPSLPVAIVTDGKRLTQVLVTLISNSLKYTYKGGIEVIATLACDGFAKFEVQDTGIGIQTSRLEYILNQLHHPKPGRTLFGLELANELVKELGGHPLKIRSQKGTSVQFLVKFSDEQAIDVVESSSSSSVVVEEGSHHWEIPQFQFTDQSCQVLIVDDIDTNRVILANLLESNSLTYLESKDGEEAVEAVKAYDKIQRPIKVIIMDIDMPVMNGWEATKAIFDLYERQLLFVKPYIIGYSAYSAPENFERASKLGMVTYIVKPANATELLSIVKALLNRENMF